MWGFIVIIPCVHKVFIFFTCIALSYPPIPYPSLSEDVHGCVPFCFLVTFLICSLDSADERARDDNYLSGQAYFTSQDSFSSIHFLASNPTLFLFIPSLKTIEECCEHSYTLPFVDSSTHEIFMKEILCNIFKCSIKLSKLYS